MSPREIPQWGPRHLDRHREPLHSDFAAAGTNWWFVWPEGNWTPDWAWFLPRSFSPFCHRWSFGFLPLSLSCLVGDTSLNVFSLVFLHYWHTIFSSWYCAVALTQFVWLKMVINKGDLTWESLVFLKIHIYMYNCERFFFFFLQIGGLPQLWKVTMIMLQM